MDLQSESSHLAESVRYLCHRFGIFDGKKARERVHAMHARVGKVFPEKGSFVSALVVGEDGAHDHRFLLAQGSGHFEIRIAPALYRFVALDVGVF